jgi:hypothetical protein
MILDLIDVKLHKRIARIITAALSIKAFGLANSNRLQGPLPRRSIGDDYEFMIRFNTQPQSLNGKGPFKLFLRAHRDAEIILS